MKILKSTIATLLIVVATSCNLDLLDDPNAVQLNQTNPSLLLNNIQVGLAGFFNTASTFGMQVTRLQNSGGSIYENFANPQAFDGLWAAAYSNVLMDCSVLIKQADQSQFTVHAGMARIMQAYVLSVLVDYFGDVPFSQAFQGQANLNPGLDDMEDVYDEIINILNRGIADIGTAPNALAPAITDFYYGGGTAGLARWVRFANSVKLKIYLNLRLLDVARATAGVTEALNAGVITAATDNFVFRYATNGADPDVRHPRFVGNYITGAGDYMSNYLMWQMFYGYNMTDPRMRFYFYRQRGANSTDPNEIRCVAQTAPPHYPFSTGTDIIYAPASFPDQSQRIPPGISSDPGNVAWSRTFCFPTPVGYWGREHVDPQGIPPDGLARTTWGPYPAGGRFDANVNAGANNPSLGMRGAGIQPIMLRSYVNFMRAEASLTLGVGGGAAAQYLLGIQNSLADVRDWAINGTYGSNANIGASPTEATTINGFFPTVGSTLANVRVATTANLSALSGLLTVDGITLVAGDRVLVKDQSTPRDNGIYEVAAGAWIRTTDADSGAELLGATVTVNEGFSNASARFVQITTGTITVGTTNLNFRSPLSDEITRYAARANAAYLAPANNDNDRLNYIAREYWISLFGNGVESYNLYRRTGKPTGMQPTVNPEPGPFPKTFWYPASFETRNSSVEQKSNLTGRVFWAEPASFNLDF